MSAEVTIERVDFLLRTKEALNASADDAVREIFSEVERYLEGSTEEVGEELFIPRIALDLVVSAGGGSIAGAVARAIGSAIVTASRGARAERPVGERHARRRCTNRVDRPRHLGEVGVGDAQGLRLRHRQETRLREATPSSAPPAVGRFFQDAREPQPLVRRAEPPGNPVERLVSIASEGMLHLLATELDESGARDLLHRIRERLRPEKKGEIVSASTRDPRLARARQRARAVLAQCHATSSRIERPLRHVELVLAIALLGRLSIDFVVQARSLANAIDDMLDHPGDRGNEWTRVERNETADEPAVEIRSSAESLLREGIGFDQGDPRAASPSGRIAVDDRLPEETTDPLVCSAIATRTGSRMECVSPDGLGPRTSAAAGIAFLLRPVHELGFWEALAAIRPEPTIALHAVLRRILELAEVRLPDEDPATWLLAGLLDAPDDDDRADEATTWSPGDCAAFARAAGADAETADYAGAVDAWARATLAETRLRLDGAEAGDALGADVIGLRGTLAIDEEALIVTMPFPGSYEALLRGGLLADMPVVSCLGGRALRFVFQEEL